MRKRFILLCLVATIGITTWAQKPEEHHREQMRPRSTFELVDQIRDSIGLDNKEFDKVYSTYEKYSKSVFGENNGIGQGQQKRRPNGGEGPGGHGGMGGPGGMGGHGGMGGRGGMHSRDNKDGQMPDFDKAKHRDQTPEQRQAEIEKLKKKKAKDEEKLCKTMKKIFKKSPDKYINWLSLRNNQLSNPGEKNASVLMVAPASYTVKMHLQLGSSYVKPVAGIMGWPPYESNF